MTRLDPILRQKLRDLGRALSAAISGSSEASRRLSELRDEGYSLYLLVDGSESPSQSHQGEPLSGEGDDRRPARRLPAVPRGEPAFRINGEDVSFLRSVGIDPTRPGRRRRPTSGG